MRRTLTVLLCLSTALGAALGAAQAAPAKAAPAPKPPARCAWTETPGAQLFRVPGRFIQYERTFVCPGEAEGRYTLRFDTLAGDRRRTADTERGEVRPFGRWPRETRVAETTAYSQLCDDRAAPAGEKPSADVELFPDEAGIERLPGRKVEVEAVFQGEGDLAPLNRTDRAIFHCDACASLREGGFLAMYEGRAQVADLRPGTRLRGDVDSAWLACARTGGRLEVRYFVGPDERALEAAIRPTYVQTGLEKAFRAGGERASLDVPAPVAELCKRAGGAKGLTVLWEVAGAGLLGGLGGGGRSHHGLRCR